MTRLAFSIRLVVMSLWSCVGCGRLGFAPLPGDYEVPGHSQSDDEGAPSESPNQPVVSPDGGVVSVVAVSEDGGLAATHPSDPHELGDAAMPPESPRGDGGTREPPAPDAGELPDATADAGGPPPVVRCNGGGLGYAGTCWYLSGSNESCSDVCRGRGGADPRAAQIVGSEMQGGSAEACAEIFASLGFRTPVYVGMRTDGLGLGCNRWDDGTLWWLSEPGFGVNARATPSARVCACAN